MTEERTNGAEGAEGQAQEVVQTTEKKGIIMRALKWFGRQFKIAYIGRGETLVQISTAVAVSVVTVIGAAYGINTLVAKHAALALVAPITGIVTGIALFGSIVFILGAERLTRLLGKLERPVAGVVKGILAVALITLLMGFAVRHADDSDVDNAFYYAKWNNPVGRFLVRCAVKSETDTYGPVKLATCNGGKAVSWYGKWYVIEGASPIDSRAVASLEQ